MSAMKSCHALPPSAPIQKCSKTVQKQKLKCKSSLGHYFWKASPLVCTVEFRSTEIVEPGHHADVPGAQIARAARDFSRPPVSAEVKLTLEKVAEGRYCILLKVLSGFDVESKLEQTIWSEQELHGNCFSFDANDGSFAFRKVPLLKDGQGKLHFHESYIIKFPDTLASLMMQGILAPRPHSVKYALKGAKKFVSGVQGDDGCEE